MIKYNCPICKSRLNERGACSTDPTHKCGEPHPTAGFDFICDLDPGHVNDEFSAHAVHAPHGGAIIDWDVDIEEYIPGDRVGKIIAAVILAFGTSFFFAHLVAAAIRGT